MPPARLIMRPASAAIERMVAFIDERTVEAWHRPNVPLLIFADSALPGKAVDFHGGPIGTGMPIQLIFWGDWWNSPDGTTRRNLIDQRTQAVLASDYFSELDQYGISRPHFRGATIVTQPGNPWNFNSNDDQKVVPDLIDSLIDDGVFPDPDDERIAFVVLIPEGFTQTIANGAHTADYNYTFPIDYDWYWVAWVRSFGPGTGDDPETTMRTLTHELVETFTDPEGDGWYCQPAATGEIGDAALSAGNVRQTAWVNDVHVTAYWSNRHGATIIPINRDYFAHITGTIDVEDERQLASGAFRPTDRDRELCKLVKLCCLEERDYPWTVTGRDEGVILRVETGRYRSPNMVWALDGTVVTGSGTQTVNVGATRFNGPDATFGYEDVRIDFTVNKDRLELHTRNVNANFDLPVTCTVNDAAFTGKLKVDVIAKPTVVVGFVGVVRDVDPAYTHQRKACNDALKIMFDSVGQLVGTPKPGDPVEGPGVISEFPAWTRIHEFARVRSAWLMTQRAHRTLPPDAAAAVVASLLVEVPILAVMPKGSGRHAATEVTGVRSGKAVS
jgi:hypothetical protein